MKNGQLITTSLTYEIVSDITKTSNRLVFHCLIGWKKGALDWLMGTLNLQNFCQCRYKATVLLGLDSLLHQLDIIFGVN